MANSPVLFSLIGAAHVMEERLERALAEVGLSFAKLNVLNRMVEAGEPLTLSEIAVRLNCVRSNVTQLVDRLEAEGLVRREAEPGDRRSIRAVLTGEGAARAKAGADVVARVNAQFEATIASVDRSALGKAIEAMT